MTTTSPLDDITRQDIGYLLTAYADGQLAPEGVMWVEEQLDRNGDLRAKLKEIRQLQAGLRTAFAGGAPAFVLDLPRRDALLASAANPPRKKIRFPAPMWIGLAASLMAIVYVGMQTGASMGQSASYEVELLSLAPIDEPTQQQLAQVAPAEAGDAQSFNYQGADGGATFAAQAEPELMAKGQRDASSRQGASESKQEMTTTASSMRPAAPAAGAPPAPTTPTAGGEALARTVGGGRAPTKEYDGKLVATPSAPPPAVAKPEALEYSRRADVHQSLDNTRAADIRATDGRPAEKLAMVQQQRQAAAPAAKNAAPAKPGAGPQTGKDKAIEELPVALAEADIAAPINQLNVPIEEKVTSEDEKGREAAVASSETGSTGAFMAIGAGGDSAGFFGNRSGGGKRRALAMADRDAENIPVLKPVGGVAGQVGDDKPAQVEIAISDTTVVPGTTVRITRNDLPVVDGKVVSVDNGRAVVAVEGLTWNKHGAKIKAGDVVSTIHPPGTVVAAQKAQQHNGVQKSYRIVDLARQLPSFPGPDLDIPEPGGVGERLLPPIKPDVDPGVNELIEIIQRVVAPDSWEKEGTGIEFYNGQMVVTNTADVQRQVDEFLATLRAQANMRGLSQATDVVASMTFLRSDMTANFSEPLDSAFDNLAQGNVVFKVTNAAEALLSRQGNVAMRDEPVARGIVRLARSAGLQVRMQGGAVEIDAPQRPISPDDTQGFDLPTFKDLFGTSPMQAIAVDAIQTVAIDADTASYEYAKARVAAGQSVDPTTIKPEHFINAMPMDYPPAHGPEAFSLYAEAAPSPFARAGTTWGPRTALVSIGAVAKPAAADERKPLALTLAIDCSGSMAQAGGLDRIQRGLFAFVEHLRAEDRVSIVAFGDQARVILPATPGNDRVALMNALANLATGGATNAAEGLGLAYQLAAETAAVGVESRVLLATDGGTVAGADDLLRRVTAFKDRGITLVVVGTGATYRAGPLQDLATKGDGQHFYVGSDADAEALFTGKLLPDRLAVLAKDAKLQVTWNPQRVSHARLIGYDQRRLAAKDFRDNTVDAGELSQDTQVTALFEVLLVDGGAGPLGTASVRYKDMRRDQVRELACPLPGTILTSQPSERLRLLACAAATAEWLQRGWWSNVHLISPQEIAAQLARCPQPIAAELREMVK